VPAGKLSTFAAPASKSLVSLSKCAAYCGESDFPNLRGVDSHGVIRMENLTAERLACRRVQTQWRPKVVSEQEIISLMFASTLACAMKNHPESPPK